MFTRSTFPVAEELLAVPTTPLHIRELARRTGLSTTAVTGAVAALEELGIVTVRDTSITKNVQANLGSDTYRQYKQALNLFLLAELQVTRTLVDVLRPQAVVLYGSFARGEDIQKSDVDILVLSDRSISALNETILESWGTRLKRRIDVRVLESLKESSPEFVEGVANGVVLFGHLRLP